MTFNDLIDQTPHLQWTDAKETYRSGHDLYLGKVRVGRTFWGQVLKDDPPWSIDSLLPGYTPKVRRFDTEEEAKAALELSVRRWQGYAGIGEE